MGDNRKRISKGRDRDQGRGPEDVPLGSGLAQNAKQGIRRRQRRRRRKLKQLTGQGG